MWRLLTAHLTPDEFGQTTPCLATNIELLAEFRSSAFGNVQNPAHQRSCWKQAGGLEAISRWLSEATPPVNRL